MTATHFTFKRPMSSFEIQKYLGRMPTKEERSQFSSWRNKNSNVDLETNETIIREQTSYTEDRYMPRSWQIKKELQELLPGRSDRICELIEQLIEAKIKDD